MSKEKPGIPQGTRDFGPEVVRKREFIFKIIKNKFELYGFEPLETPAMENLETLMGKYGEEGDKLIFKIRSNSNLFNKYPEGANKIKNVLKDVTSIEYTFLPTISNKALRYDLTIPFARYVAMNYGKLSLPFKRYQIQPVWRGDKPQKGRYREFFQCDADVIGSNSLLNEVDLILLYNDVFEALNVEVEIRINNRKILAGLAELTSKPDKLIEITTIIDKLDKIGINNIRELLAQLDLDQRSIDIVSEFITTPKKTSLAHFYNLFFNSPTGRQGLDEIQQVLKYLPENIKEKNIIIDSSLARGLNYYTGCIFEVKAKNVKIGSIGGGGRYDNLTGLFGIASVSGVGISFGLDRIYDVMEELNLFPNEVTSGTRVLFFNMGEDEAKIAHQTVNTLRQVGISCELFHESVKMDKQFKYAEKKRIPFVAIIGSREMQEDTCVIKDLRSGEQKTLTLANVINYSFI